MSEAAALSLLALTGVPEVRPGDDLAQIILDALAACEAELRADDVVILAQKIVSKAEGRMVDLATVMPSPRAIVLAKQADKDPRVVELLLGESTEIVRVRPGVIIV